MGNLTKYGQFVVHLPRTNGRIYYVAPSAEYRVGGRVIAASDNYPGDDPMKPLLTIAAALTRCTANAGDIVALFPGTHTQTASLAMSTAGVTLSGLDGSLLPSFTLPRVNITGPVGDQAINVTAARVEITGIRFTCITAITCIDFSVAADQLYIHDCSFDMSTAVASTSTVAIGALGAANQVWIDRCYVDEAGAQGPAIDMTATLDGIISNCVIQQQSGTWAIAILIGAATDRCLISKCDVASAGTGALTTGVDGTSATIANGVTLLECIFGKRVTVAIDGFDAGEAQLANNYTADAGTPGGTLLVAIT